MVRIMQLLMVRFVAHIGRRRDERGEGAVPWLIVLGAGVAIAYFAGDSVFAFARQLVSGLGK